MMPDTRPDILVSHPGNARVYDMVAALTRAGLRVHFATGFYYEPDGLAARLARHLPASLRDRADRTLRRRRHPGIGPGIVDGAATGEVVTRALRRAGFSEAASNRAFNAFYDRRGARLVRRLRPRAVLAAETCALLAFRAAASIGAPCILDQVIGFEGEGARLLSEEVARHPELAASASWADAATVARCREEARTADRIFAPSEYVRDTLTAAGVDAARIALLPYGVDVARFRPAPRAPDGRFRVLFVGQIGARKGVRYLLEAFRHAALPESELVLAGAVAGDGAWLRPYRGLYRHIAHVPYHEVHTLYRDADVFVFPSLHEGMALSVLEAMASGLPVITTHNAGAPVRDGAEGFVVSIRDAAAIRDRLRALHADAALRQRMGESARRQAEAYDLARYERGLAAEIGRILGKSSC